IKTYCQQHVLHTIPTRRSSDLSRQERQGKTVERTKNNNHLNGGGGTGSGSAFSSSTYVPMMDMPRGGFGLSFGMEIGGEIFGLRSEEHTELQSRENLVCRLLLE